MASNEHVVALAVYSSRMKSAELAELIGLEPDERQDRGEVSRSGPAAEHSKVAYASGLPREVSANEQIAALLDRLRPFAARIGEVSAMADGKARLSVGYFINEPQWLEHARGLRVRGHGVCLGLDDIQLLEAMGAEFWLDLYVPAEE